MDFGAVQIQLQILIYSSRRWNVQLISRVYFEVSLYSLTGAFVDIRIALNVSPYKSLNVTPCTVSHLFNISLTSWQVLPGHSEWQVPEKRKYFLGHPKEARNLCGHPQKQIYRFNSHYVFLVTFHFICTIIIRLRVVLS